MRADAVAASGPIKRYQDSIFKLLTLSTNSVTNVVRTAYFQIQARSSPLKICDRVCTQSKKLKDAILVAFDRPGGCNVCSQSTILQSRN